MRTERELTHTMVNPENGIDVRCAAFERLMATNPNAIYKMGQDKKVEDFKREMLRYMLRNRAEGKHLGAGDGNGASNGVSGRVISAYDDPED
jgi:hypothetical protein